MNNEIFKCNFLHIVRFTKINECEIAKEMKAIAAEIKSGKIDICDITNSKLTYTDILKSSYGVVASVLGRRDVYNDAIDHKEGLLDAVCYAFERIVRRKRLNVKELEVLKILCEKEFKTTTELLTYLYCL